MGLAGYGHVPEPGYYFEFYATIAGIDHRRVTEEQQHHGETLIATPKSFSHVSCNGTI